MKINKSESGERSFTFPSREDMQRKLETVDSANPDLKSKLYPVLLEEAGNELFANGIAMVLLSAVNKYVAEVYKGEKGMVSLEAQAILTNEVPKIIDALVEDHELADQAKNEINEALPHLSALFQTNH